MALNYICNIQLALYFLYFLCVDSKLVVYALKNWDCMWGGEGKQVGSMDEESQVRGCYNITFIGTPANQETVPVLEDTSKQNI